MKKWRWTKTIEVDGETEQEARLHVNSALEGMPATLVGDYVRSEELGHIHCVTVEFKQLWPVPNDEP